MKIFINLKSAHEHYNYPSSHRFGTIGNEKGVIRSYSNGKNCDKILKDGKLIYYRLKNEKVKEMYKINIKSKRKIRFFSKIKEGVLDMGLYLPVSILEKSQSFIKLIKV